MKDRVVRPGVNRLDHTDVSSGKGGFTILEVEVPFAHELVIKSQSFDRVDLFIEAVMPELEGLGVSSAEIFETMKEKVAGAIGRLIETRDAQEQGAWEDVLLDPIHAFA